MEEVMISWRDRGRGGGTNLDGTASTTAGENDVPLPLGPGEWDDALGLPLCVVCQNVSFQETHFLSISPSLWACRIVADPKTDRSTACRPNTWSY